MMSKPLMNKAKSRMLSGQAALGAVLVIPSPDVAAIMARQGFDFLLLDAQHANWNLQTAGEAFRNIVSADNIPMVRVTWNEPYAIGAMLDRGALGIVVPMVETADDARRAVKSVCYGPQGWRSIGGGGMRHWLPILELDVRDEVFFAVQIETRRGVENATDILSIDGVDGCWVGPSDLSLSLGLGVAPDADEGRQTLENAIHKVLSACRETGKVPGIYGGREASRWLEEGFLFVTVAVDSGCLAAGAADTLTYHTQSPRR
jgi:4-hydroxy-2-oxoheptanedioate aldolase